VQVLGRTARRQFEDLKIMKLDSETEALWLRTARALAPQIALARRCVEIDRERSHLDRLAQAHLDRLGEEAERRRSVRITGF
jgi:hypothetical protein